jgi:hypothetical protein
MFIKYQWMRVFGRRKRKGEAELEFWMCVSDFATTTL